MSAVTDSKVSEVLNAAATLIENAPSLAKGAARIETAEGPAYCAIGALGVAASRAIPGSWDNDWYRHRSSELQFQAADRLREHLGLGPMFISIWNDDPRRTQAEVVEALRAAAKAHGS